MNAVTLVSVTLAPPLRAVLGVSCSTAPFPLVTWTLLLSLVLLPVCTEKPDRACVQPTLPEHRQDGSGWLLCQ